MKDPSKTKIAYVLRRFPKLSETFVLNEILQLEQLGLDIVIVSLESPPSNLRHGHYSSLKAPITYLPELWRVESHLQAHRKAINTWEPYFRVMWQRIFKAGRPRGFWRFTQAVHLSRIACESNVSHLHAHFATRATTVSFLSSELTGTPFSFTAHAVDLYSRSVDNEDLPLKCKKAKFLITISEFNRHFLQSRVGGHSEKAQLVRNGIDLDRFLPGNPGRKSPYSLLCVARLVEKKGLGYLVESCRILKERGIEFRCQVVGEGKLERKLRRQVSRLGLLEQLQFLGPLPQERVIELYQNADLFVLPSVIASDGDQEGLPVSVVEALACGVPVVSTDTSGLKEVVRHGYNGFLVPQRDAGALANTIEMLIRDPKLCTQIARNTRLSITDEYDIQKTTLSLFRLFTGLPND